jgi:hypothetical protein
MSALPPLFEVKPDIGPSAATAVAAPVAHTDRMLVGRCDHCRSNGTLDPSRRSVIAILALGLSICRKRAASIAVSRKSRYVRTMPSSLIANCAPEPSRVMRNRRSRIKGRGTEKMGAPAGSPPPGHRLSRSGSRGGMGESRARKLNPEAVWAVPPKVGLIRKMLECALDALRDEAVGFLDRNLDARLDVLHGRDATFIRSDQMGLARRRGGRRVPRRVPHSAPLPPHSVALGGTASTTHSGNAG